MSRSISVFGGTIAQVALILYVFHRYQNGLAVGVLLFARVVPLCREFMQDAANALGIAVGGRKFEDNEGG